MSGGLRTGFDGVMAGLSANDVEPPIDADQVLVTPCAADSFSTALARRILGHAVPADRRPAVMPLRFVPMTGGAEVELDDSSSGVLIIGRAEVGAQPPDRQLVIDRAVVSRRHCQVIVTPGGFGVIDLGAANATGVMRDGVLQHVADAPFLLQPGDLISTFHGEHPMVHVEVARS